MHFLVIRSGNVNRELLMCYKWKGSSRFYHTKNYLNHDWEYFNTKTEKKEKEKKKKSGIGILGTNQAKSLQKRLKATESFVLCSNFLSWTTAVNSTENSALKKKTQ